MIPEDKKQNKYTYHAKDNVHDVAKCNPHSQSHPFPTSNITLCCTSIVFFCLTISLNHIV